MRLAEIHGWITLVEARGLSRVSWLALLDGQDGHGTPRQEQSRRLSRVPAFRAWFGNSIVVDRDGLPLMLFHGTGKSFSAFAAAAAKPGSELGPGIYLTNDPTYAADYAGEHGRLVPLYVAVTNVIEHRAAWRAMRRDPAWYEAAQRMHETGGERMGAMLGRFARARGYQAIAGELGPGIMQLCVFDPVRIKPAYAFEHPRTTGQPREATMPKLGRSGASPLFG